MLNPPSQVVVLNHKYLPIGRDNKSTTGERPQGFVRSAGDAALREQGLIDDGDMAA
ncbi:hypothetical protein JOY44_26375 (plasmid) [Phormidium sp. CLA17]|uniref:hypothetical protein n=1 Tax=Leptolyngbya sp. Cla-17 TaxID=2803751 RepID=UPI001492F3F3|nr:hypothetical protein [Leptolyngbya sp. Cla-17]MBM0745047.1 hypothetical protein [Leptolyngbya sp. Cla-17]